MKYCNGNTSTYELSSLASRTTANTLVWSGLALSWGGTGTRTDAPTSTASQCFFAVRSSIHFACAACLFRQFSLTLSNTSSLARTPVMRAIRYPCNACLTHSPPVRHVGVTSCGFPTIPYLDRPFDSGVRRRRGRGKGNLRSPRSAWVYVVRERTRASQQRSTPDRPRTRGIGMKEDRGVQQRGSSRLAPEDWVLGNLSHG